MRVYSSTLGKCVYLYIYIYTRITIVILKTQDPVMFASLTNKKQYNIKPKSLDPTVYSDLFYFHRLSFKSLICSVLCCSVHSARHDTRDLESECGEEERK